MACSANLFPQIGTLRDHNNVFYVQGYSGFGVTPSHIVQNSPKGSTAVPTAIAC